MATHASRRGADAPGSHLDASRPAPHVLPAAYWLDCRCWPWSDLGAPGTPAIALRRAGQAVQDWLHTLRTQLRAHHGYAVIEEVRQRYASSLTSGATRQAHRCYRFTNSILTLMQY